MSVIFWFLYMLKVSIRYAVIFILDCKMDKLEYTPEIEEETAEIFKKLEGIIPEEEWPVHAPHIAAINRLKKERNAVILAHNYQTPEIYHGVADLVGDSLGMARMGAETDAEVIVVSGVHFMAETAKLLSPEKTILIPDPGAGCSLADSITAEDVRMMKSSHPGIPVVTYVNTSAAVKAETDICCTSSNAVKVVDSLESDQVIFLPDEHLGRYVASKTDKKLILWMGSCEVHRLFKPEEIRELKKSYKGIKVIAHPECTMDVLEEADFVGSTSGMMKYVDESKPSRVVLITECSMSDNLAVDFPETEFIRPCNLCPHMKMISLQNIYKSLVSLAPEIEIPAEIALPARRSVERMLEIS